MAGFALFLHKPAALLSYFICGIIIVSCELNLNIPHGDIPKALSLIAEAREAIIHAEQSPHQDWVQQMSIPVRPSLHRNASPLKQLLGGHLSAGRKSDANETKTDVLRNLTELIASEGYPCERFTVQTQDGFLLDLHRIPHGREAVEKSPTKSPEKPIVFLQHGLLSTACDWVMNFWNDSLGFILADAGYDVWMGNTRGNTYSRKHITYSPKDVKFWDWSIDEMAKYDTTAFIDFILNKTGQSSLNYIGHSQGTTMAFAMLSRYPSYQNKVHRFVALAPVTSPIHAKSPIIYMSKVPDEVVYFLFGRKDFLPNDFYVKAAVDHLCKLKTTRWFCDNILLLMTGPDVSNLNQSRLVVYMNHTPAGVSVKDLIHYAQLHREGKFTMYNYGSDKANEKRYGQPTPPTYDVTKIKVPVVMFSAAEDWLAVPEHDDEVRNLIGKKIDEKSKRTAIKADDNDVKYLRTLLPNVKAWYQLPKWNHLDFVWGSDAANVCYKKIIPLLA